MKSRLLFTSLLVVAAMMMASAAFAAPSLAGAQHIALTGEEIRYFGPAGDVFFANGWVQVRDQQINGNFSLNGDGITLMGTDAQLSNAKIDATNNGYASGKATYTMSATGVTCTGPIHGKIIDALGTLAVVAPCSDGSLLMGTWQDVEVYPPNTAPPQWVRSEFNGVLLAPGQF